MREISKEEFKKSIIENVKNRRGDTAADIPGCVLCDQGCYYRRLDCNSEAV